MASYKDIIAAGADIIGLGHDIIGEDDIHLQAAERSPQVADAIVARQGVAVVDRKATKVRRQMLPFPPTPLGPSGSAGQQQIVITTPQQLFKGRRLIIPSDIAGAVTINDIKIANQSQFLTNSGGTNGPTVPGRAFSEVAVELLLDLDTAQVNNQVSLVVQNISGGSVMFYAALFGVAVY
ncbi:MAG: hypothetical protein ACHREM_12185 [Polyangiales bacterium]